MQVDIRLDLSCTLSTEHQAIVNALNRFLAWLPEDEDPDVALRLALAVCRREGFPPNTIDGTIAAI